MITQLNISDDGEIGLVKLKQVAMINGLKKSKPDLIELAIKIAVNSIEMLDNDSFEQINGLKK